jgi:hypothetical protein
MYVLTTYDSLLSLHHAAKLLDEIAKKHLFKDIWQLFLNNNVYNKYGVSLLHKHFLINKTERLVNCRHTSAAWTVGYKMTDVVEKYEGFIMLRLFRFLNKGPILYKFAFLLTKPLYNKAF